MPSFPPENDFAREVREVCTKLGVKCLCWNLWLKSALESCWLLQIDRERPQRRSLDAAAVRFEYRCFLGNICHHVFTDDISKFYLAALAGSHRSWLEFSHVGIVLAPRWLPRKLHSQPAGMEYHAKTVWSDDWFEQRSLDLPTWYGDKASQLTWPICSYPLVLGHHPFTNIADIDPDVTQSDPGLVRVHDSQSWWSYYEWQSYYFLPLYSQLILSRKVTEWKSLFIDRQFKNIRINPLQMSEYVWGAAVFVRFPTCSINQPLIRAL